MPKRIFESSAPRREAKLVRPRIHEEDYTHDRFLLEGKVLAKCLASEGNISRGTLWVFKSQSEKSMTLPYSTFEEGRPSMMDPASCWATICENCSPAACASYC